VAAAEGAEALMDTRPGDRIAEELAALRRVAALVAGGAPPEEVFAAVAAEAGRLLGTDLTTVSRYAPDGEVTVLGAWSSTGAAIPLSSVGTRISSGGQNIATLVFQTCQPVRIDDYGRTATGVPAAIGRGWGYRAAVGAPITVEGQLWGLMTVASTGEEQLPADTEARLAGFSELVGTAIASAQARVELRGYAEEQAALRRVATLVATGAPPEEVFAAVAAQTGRLLGTDLTAVGRYEPGEVVTIVGAWSGAGVALPSPIGTRTKLGGQNMVTLVFRTSRPVRIDDYRDATGAAAGVGSDWGFRAAVSAPIAAGGRLWGIMTVASVRQQPLPADTEARLTGFTELVGTAIANAEAQAALAASRARIAAAADETRRRIERDLHDGAQQRLVSLALQLREAQATAPPGASELVRSLDGVAAGLDAALEELREIARGIHPAVLAEAGLGPALRTLARRCAVPVNLRLEVADRPPDRIEIAAYYLVSEALTNTVKHADASVAEVGVVSCDGVLRVCVRDDGDGGADFDHGSGLVGLKDRVEALGGTIVLRSPPGEGTALEARIPLAGQADGGAGQAGPGRAVAEGALRAGTPPLAPRSGLPRRDFLPCPSAAHARRMFRNDVRAGPRGGVPGLNQDPPALACAGQGEASGQLAAAQGESEVAGLVAGYLGGALVPDDHRAATPPGSLVHPLELTGRQLVILDRDG
jgi:signal transduction histidine kinase